MSKEKKRTYRTVDVFSVLQIPKAFKAMAYFTSLGHRYYAGVQKSNQPQD